MEVKEYMVVTIEQLRNMIQNIPEGVIFIISFTESGDE